MLNYLYFVNTNRLTDMITILVIAVVIILIFIMFKNKKNNLNPIDSICFNGTMGILIGDSFEFALSRAKHLGINVDRTTGKDYIQIAYNQFNNVEKIELLFKDNKLHEIVIVADYSSYGKDELYNILVSRLSRILNKEPETNLVFYSNWKKGNNEITLSSTRELSITIC